MAKPAVQPLSYGAYLELERATDTRHEFYDGVAVAMSGGTARHSRLKVNLVRALGNALAGGPRATYDSDFKIVVPAVGFATYPDAAVICGPLGSWEHDRHAATNPTAVFEVLCRGTEAWDRGGKFDLLGHVDALRHYVLVSQDQVRVELFTRRDDGWDLTRYGPGDRVPLGAIGVEIHVDALYEQLPELTDDERPRLR